MVFMKKGDKVKIITFDGKTCAEEAEDCAENYWKLIGKMGVVQQDPQEKTIYAHFSQEPRVLVKFSEDLMASYGLHAHNNIGNSLCILVSDLEIIG